MASVLMVLNGSLGMFIFFTCQDCSLNCVSLLQQASTLLAELDQSPPQSTHNAMKGCSEALVSSALLKHKDKEVGLLVAICISEIMRIVAPDAPYSDDTLKVVSFLVTGTSSLHVVVIARSVLVRYKRVAVQESSWKSLPLHSSLHLCRRN